MAILVYLLAAQIFCNDKISANKFADNIEAVKTKQTQPLIDEDLSHLDLTKLPILSKIRRKNPDCEWKEEDVTEYIYETKNKEGEDVRVVISNVELVSIEQHSVPLVRNEAPWIKGHSIITPHLNCLDQDNEELVNSVRKMLVGPSEKPYNFSQPVEKNINGEVDQPVEVDKIIFGGEVKDGFFVEAGANNAETDSDSLYFEINHGWNGLLVEPHPLNYQEGLLKNRKANHIQTCLSTNTTPQTVWFDPVGAVWEGGNRLSAEGITLNPENNHYFTFPMQCFPLYTILLALGNPTVNYFSLDVEGAEFPILKTIPWEKVDIQAISVETFLLGKLFPGSREELLEYMSEVGYQHVPWAHKKTNSRRTMLGVTDDLFVKNGISLRMKKDEL